MCDFPGFLCVFFFGDFGCFNFVAYYRCFRLNYRFLSVVPVSPGVSNLLDASFPSGTCNHSHFSEAVLLCFCFAFAVCCFI